MAINLARNPALRRRSADRRARRPAAVARPPLLLIEHVQQRTVQHTLWPTLIGLPILVLVIWALLGWGLRPLQRLHRHLRNRAVESLEPLQAGPSPPELQPMRATLEHLLEQLGADPTALSILLRNLVGNALNFAPARSEIQIVLERAGPCTMLRIMDEGPAVSDELLDRLCDRFHSAGNPQSAGLGLLIVEVIARRLDASLAFPHRPRGGLSVELRLPTPTPG